MDNLEDGRSAFALVLYTALFLCDLAFGIIVGNFFGVALGFVAFLMPIVLFLFSLAVQVRREIRRLEDEEHQERN